MNKKKLPNDTSTADPSSPSVVSIQAKLVLLTLSFPRLRILWSSSPYESATLFNELKMHRAEPDPLRAIAIGAEDTNGSGTPQTAGTDVNTAAEEMVRALPGVTAGNVAYIMRRAGSVRGLCEMSLSQVQSIMGVEPGKVCWEFLHQGE
jgi:DNA excision repair protein ERCC-4